MKKILILLIMSFITHVITFSQNYSINNIPEELKKNARTIVRVDNSFLELKSEGRAIQNSILARTIMNESGLDDAVLQLFHNKQRKVRINSAIVYDKNGKKVKKIPPRDFLDISAISGFSLYEDSRVKIVDPEYKKYPFTVEYDFTYYYNGTLHLPEWNPYDDYDLSIQNSELTVLVPNDMTIRYYEQNSTNKVEIEKAAEHTKYSWKAKDLTAIKQEPFSTPGNASFPHVSLALNDFSFDKESGNQKTWNDIGKWVYNLNSERKELPPETVAKLNEMVSGLDEDYKKVRLLYQYLQDNTRYVSIQIGIGGYQPFEAETVDRLGYGDCKALTNYLQTALEYIDIESYYTLVKAGSNTEKIKTDFPSVQFNHAFLCVPIEKDTLWLECTSQTNPCGFLGTFTDDRDVLIIKEDGGHMVHTKVYNAKENNISTKAEVKLTDDGKGHVDLERIYKGLYYRIGDRIMRSDDGDKKKLMYKYIDIPHFDLIGYSHEAFKQRIPWIVENVELELGNYATTMGSNMFLTLNLMNRIEDSPKEVNNRRSDVFIRRSRSENDTITYIIPQGYQASGIPEEINIESKFGRYSAKVIQEEGKLTYIRYFELIKGTHPKEEYADLIEFFDKIVSADQKKIALKKVD